MLGTEGAVCRDRWLTLQSPASIEGHHMTVMEKPSSLEADELHTLLTALMALRKGDASVRLPLHWPGMAGRVADAFNEVVEQNVAMADELSRLRQVVGRQGKLKQRASLREARGFWGDSIESINSLIDDLVHPTSEVICRRAWRSRSTAVRSRASSCAPPRPSTRWSTS
jgi:hypothetical protein